MKSEQLPMHRPDAFYAMLCECGRTRREHMGNSLAEDHSFVPRDYSPRAVEPVELVPPWKDRSATDQWLLANPCTCAEYRRRWNQLTAQCETCFRMVP